MEENKDNLEIKEKITEITAEEVDADNSADEDVFDEVSGVSEAEEAVLLAVTAVDTTAPEAGPEKKKRGTVKKILKGLGIFLLVAFLAVSGYVGYRVWEYMQVYVYTTQHTAPVTFENEKISLTIDSMEIIDEIIGFTPDENYVYIGVKSTIVNKTQEPLEWKNFPLLSVREYIRDEEDTGYILVENTDQAYEMTALRNYAIDLELDMRPAKDNLEAGASRTTADIFRILKSDYEAKNYFLTTDLFNEIVELPELPVPEDIPATDNAE